MKILITGGAGFIGTNVAKFYASQKHSITILDNFSRKGANLNADFLEKEFSKITIIQGDVRDFNTVSQYVSRNEIIFHLAGQVAVTTSIKNPREDFESNVLGTFNVLEAARLSGHKPLIIESSTNKVYGKAETTLIKKNKRYVDMIKKNGVSENAVLDFYSPYGCSKGAADQYTHDYYRVFGVPTVVFRQSCIYGQHQLGVEDQGWVAHFIIKALFGKPITIFGTGYQVRDILFIDDLISAYDKVISNGKKVRGEIFNIGGGISNAISLLELIDLLEQKLGSQVKIEFKKKRLGDQDFYISNNNKLKTIIGWYPKIGIEDGLSQLIYWIKENKRIIREFS